MGPWYFRLRARRPVDHHGHLPSLGFLRQKGRRCPLQPAVSPALPPDCSTWTCFPGPLCAPVFVASFSLKVERRFMRRVDHRIQSRGSGCPVHKKQLLPVLVVWAPPRKKRSSTPSMGTRRPRLRAPPAE